MATLSGYRPQTCLACGARFRVLAAAPSRWCSLACATALRAQEWRRRSA